MNYEFEKMYEDERWKNLSHKIRSENNWCCINCGVNFSKQKFKLNAHHTYYWIDEPVWSNKYKSGDIIPLCDFCHNEYHQNNDNIYKGETSYSREWIKYWEEQKRLKREEELEWMEFYYMHNNDDLHDEYGFSITNVYHTINSLRNWSNKSDNDKKKYGKYASRMCNYLGIEIEKVAVKRVWKFENSYPTMIFIFLNKKINEGKL